MASINMAAIKDAVMGKQFSGGTFSGWNGQDNHIQVGATSSYKWRGVIKFPLWTMPSYTQINSATLRLYFYSTETPHAVQDVGQLTNMKIGRMTADWSEGTINPGDGNLTSQLDWDWDNRYNKFTAAIVENNIDQTATGNSIDIDVTNITKDWLVDNNANYGFILINDSSESNDAKALLFYSQNFGSGYAPKLIVDYDVNTAPTEVADTSPVDGSTVNSLTPSFFGRMVDADSDDVAYWKMKVYATGNPSDLFWSTTVIPVQSGTFTISGAGNTLQVPYGYNPYTSVQILKPLVSGDTYDWVMTLYDKGGLSVDSAVSSFTTNAPPNAPNVTVTPAPVSAVPDDTPNFSVVHNDPDPSDSLMDGYTLVLQKETTFGSGDWSQVWTTGDVDVSGSPVASVNITSVALDWGASYRVYARTQDGNGAWGPFSSPVSFQTQKTTAPTGLTPSGGEVIGGLTPILSGQRGSASDTITKFSLRVYSEDLTTAMLAETEYTTTTNGTTFSRLYSGSSLVAGTTYKWSAKVYSAVGGYSDWSTWQTFTTQSDASVPTITSPIGDNNYNLTPTITMTRASNFNALEYEVYPESATTANLGASSYASGTITQTAATSWSDTYPVGATLLEWATGYKIRARASSDGGSNWSPWSGLSWFTTNEIDGSPILVSVDGDTDATNAWIANASPYFEISKYPSDAGNIDSMRYQIWNASGSAYNYDSGMIDVADASTAQVTHDSDAYGMIPGTSYKWRAMYTSTTGPTTPWSDFGSFRLNGPPTASAGVFPPPGHVFKDTDAKTFISDFSDPEEATFADYPIEWQIRIWNDDTDSQHGSTQVKTTGLTAGENTTTWTGLALVNGTNYSWQYRFQDSKSDWGAWSAPQGFRVSSPPNGTIQTPSDDSTVTTVTPLVTWTITGDQARYQISIDRTNSDGGFLERITTLDYNNETDTSDSVTIPAGYLLDGKYYDLTLTIWNTDLLQDPTPSTVNVYVSLDAPNPIYNVDGVADLDKSTMKLTWDQMALKTNHTFVAYRIYRRIKSYTSWTKLGDVGSQSTLHYTDWYAGHNVNYEYTVRAVTKKSGASLELVSGDDPLGTSIIDAQIASPDWHLIGDDRSPEHNSLLVVEDESHNRPIQQEVFETLGSDRKVIMRGFVLGHEGSISTLWFNDEVIAPEDSQLLMTDTYRGKRIVDYLTRNPGPHILKSPFGDVWDVQFATPQYQWLPTGHLSVELEWIETGNTSEGEY